MPMVDQRPAWLAPLADPRNEAILSAAFDVFQEKGLHGATMLEIATAAKVSKETLYARFDSKEGLFYALLAWGSRKSALDGDAIDLNQFASPVAALDAYAADMLRKMLHPEAIAVHRIVTGEATRMPEVVRVYDEFTCQAGDQALKPVAEALRAAGAVRFDAYDDFREAFIGLLRGNLVHEVTLGLRPAPDDSEVDAYAHRAMGWLLKAFGA